MNEQARKKARRAELEYVLIECWAGGFARGKMGFVEWLERKSALNDFTSYAAEAKELIALYEEGG